MGGAGKLEVLKWWKRYAEELVIEKVIRARRTKKRVRGERKVERRGAFGYRRTFHRGR
jgi:hypothetical protein